MKVLIIAFVYPPLGGSGVQRTLKFSKYLPEFGWQPYVVCSDDPDVFTRTGSQPGGGYPGGANLGRLSSVAAIGRWAQSAAGI
jgi:hypothetical protein